MPLKTFVKVGSISNLSDARYCAGMGVDMLGFRTIQGEESYITPGHFQEIRGWINGPLVVAEIYGIKNPGELAAILENYKPDYLEMSLKELTLFSTLPLPLLLFVEKGDLIKDLPFKPDYLVSRQIFYSPFPLLIEIQSKDEVQTLLDSEQVKGFVLHGTVELKPGLKEIELMADVLELLELED
ncbi:MAG TPA: hypothetical protein VJ184_09265 [Chryseolinea sp.]|nr:hypothetical protein [Chryseolinea sp.]